MSSKWYFASAEQTFGPFSAVQLQEFAASGRLQRQDTVWKEGMETGVLATKVRYLFTVPPVGAAPAVTVAVADPAIQDVPEPAPVADDTAPPLVPAVPIPPVVSEAADLSPESQPDAPARFSAADLAPEKYSGLAPASEAARKRRVIGVKGGILSSQDGEVVKYRKVCLRCKYADTSMTTMRIRGGTTRVNFFCPKCKKSQQCEIQGVGG